MSIGSMALWPMAYGLWSSLWDSMSVRNAFPLRSRRVLFGMGYCTAAVCNLFGTVRTWFLQQRLNLTSRSRLDLYLGVIAEV
jgi:hypothetical protein